MQCQRPARSFLHYGICSHSYAPGNFYRGTGIQCDGESHAGPAAHGGISRYPTTKPMGIGTGLGLSLCRGIIERHDGTLTVMSQPGQGASSCVELPIEAVCATAPVSPDRDRVPAVPDKSILIIDDEPSIASGLKRLLSRDGYTVETAANGHLALTKLRERSYDLLLSDMRMPEIDGPSLYRILECQYPHLLRRVIFLTGDTLNPETRRFLDQSAAPCLAKPCTVNEIRRAIQQVLETE